MYSCTVMWSSPTGYYSTCGPPGRCCVTVGQQRLLLSLRDQPLVGLGLRDEALTALGFFHHIQRLNHSVEVRGAEER